MGCRNASMGKGTYPATLILRISYLNVAYIAPQLVPDWSIKELIA